MIKQILKFGLLITGIMLFSNTTLAATNFTCNDVNNQAEGPLKGKIVVINEERLGAPSSNTDQGITIKNCFRASTCKYTKVEGEKPSDFEKQNPRYEWKCLGGGTTNGAKKYLVMEKCEPVGSITSNPKEGDSYFICDPIQVVVSESGLDLLYGYIGMIYRFATIMGGVITVFLIIMGGILVASAGDDQERMNKAKTLIARSIGGLVVLFLSALILYVINPNFFTV